MLFTPPPTPTLIPSLRARVTADQHVTPDDLAFIRKTLLQWGVVFFRDQHIHDPATHLGFAKRLGKPDVHPIAAGLPDFPEVLQVRVPC